MLHEVSYPLRLLRFLDVVDVGILAPACPVPAGYRCLNNTVPGAHGFNGIAVSNVDADMPRGVNQDAGNLRHGSHAALFRCLGIDLVSADIRHSVTAVVDIPAFGVMPAVTLDEPNTVGSPDTQVVCP